MGALRENGVVHPHIGAKVESADANDVINIDTRLNRLDDRGVMINTAYSIH